MRLLLTHLPSPSPQEISGQKLRVEFARIPRPGTERRENDRGRDSFRNGMGRDDGRPRRRSRSRSPRERRRSPLHGRERGSRDRERGFHDDYRMEHGGAVPGYFDGPMGGPHHHMGPPFPPGPPVGGPQGSRGFQGPPPPGGPHAASRRVLLDTPPRHPYDGPHGPPGELCAEC